MKKFVLLTIITLIFVKVATVYAGGVNRPAGIGPRAASMSGASIGVVDDVSAFYYNPAGLPQIRGTYTFVGVEFMLPKFRYGLPDEYGGFSETSEGDIYYLPLAGMFRSIGNGLTIGLGVNVPYGLGAKFKGNPVYGFSETESLITLTNISPAVAWRRKLFSGIFSIGGTANIGYGQLKLKAPFLATSNTFGSANSKAYGFGLGATGGLLFRNEDSPWRSIGLIYQTKTRVGLSGETDFTVGGANFVSDNFTSHFTFPARFGIGTSFYPSENWLVAFDVNSYDYSDTDYLKIDYDNLPTDDQLLDWDNNYSLHLGTEYQVGKKLALRAGAGYQTSAVPDKTVNPLTPDTSGYDITAGFGYSWKSISLDASYIYAWGDRDVNISPNNPAPGKYEADIHILALGLNYNF